MYTFERIYFRRIRKGSPLCLFSLLVYIINTYCVDVTETYMMVHYLSPIHDDDDDDNDDDDHDETILVHH